MVVGIGRFFPPEQRAGIEKSQLAKHPSSIAVRYGTEQVKSELLQY